MQITILTSAIRGDDEGGHGGADAPSNPLRPVLGGGCPLQNFRKKTLKKGKNGAEGDVLAKFWHFWRNLAPSKILLSVAPAHQAKRLLFPDESSPRGDALETPSGEETSPP